MRIQGAKYLITPICTKNRGINGAVEFTLADLKDKLTKSLTACPKDNFEITLTRIKESKK